MFVGFVSLTIGIIVGTWIIVDYFWNTKEENGGAINSEFIFLAVKVYSDIFELIFWSITRLFTLFN